jgi:hypothetical protein
MILASNDDFFVWSSEKATIHKAMRPWVERFGMQFQNQKPDISFAPMADDTAWLIGENGLEYHGKFKTLGHQYNEPFRRTYEQYAERKARWDGMMSHTAQRNARATEHKEQIARKRRKDKWDDAWCLKCQREWYIPKGADPAGFTCNVKKEGCGGKLVEPPIINVVDRRGVN